MKHWKLYHKLVVLEKLKHWEEATYISELIRVGHKITQMKELGLWGVDYNLQTEV